jgi:trigger factor
MVLGLSSDVKVKVTSEKDCLHTLSVEMASSIVQEKIGKAFEIVRGKVKLPGFRPGKAPIEVVREKFKDAAYEEAQDLLLRDGVAEALKTKKLTPVQPPTVTSAQFHPDKPFQFEFQVEVAPNFKLSNYKGLKVNKPVKPLTDDDVTKALEGIANMNARLVESKAETLGTNHFAVINYEGFLDGKPLTGAKADNFLMDMSAPQSIAGLAEGLAGAKAGENRDVTVTFPADSPAKELAGKQAVFKVNVVAIKEKSIPAIDDEFAKDLGVESVAVLKGKLRESLQQERDRESRAEVEKQITDRLLDGNAFAVPPTLVQRHTEYLLNRQRERMGQQGLSAEDVEKLIERLKADAQKEAEKEVRLAYIMNALAEAENIGATDDEINARISAILQRSQPQERASLEKALKGGYRERIENEVREGKLLTWLIDNAKVKEVQEAKK